MGKTCFFVHVCNPPPPPHISLKKKVFYYRMRRKEWPHHTTVRLAKTVQLTMHTRGSIELPAASRLLTVHPAQPHIATSSRGVKAALLQRGRNPHELILPARSAACSLPTAWSSPTTCRENTTCRSLTAVDDAQSVSPQRTS